MPHFDFGRASLRPQRATRAQEFTTTQPRPLKTTKSRAISCELRSTSCRTRFESKLAGHREAGATLSSAPLGQLYRPVFAPPSQSAENPPV